jgi:hypothetical protein
MTIQFYLDNEEETEITTMYDMQSNPFAVGDIVHLDVEELYPIDYNKYKESFQKTLIQSNEELETKFKRKKVKLVRVGKYMRFKVIDKTQLTIEYHCEIVE